MHKITEEGIKDILSRHINLPHPLDWALEEYHAVRAPTLERYKEIRDTAQRIFITERLKKGLPSDEKSFCAFRDLAWSCYLRIVNEAAEVYRRHLAIEYLNRLSD